MLMTPAVLLQPARCYVATRVRQRKRWSSCLLLRVVCLPPHSVARHTRWQAEQIRGKKLMVCSSALW